MRVCTKIKGNKHSKKEYRSWDWKRNVGGFWIFSIETYNIIVIKISETGLVWFHGV